MEDKSLIEIAFEVISKEKVQIDFKDLWEKVAKVKGLSEEEKADRVSQFYTNLLLDGRFVTLGENLWDLRERHKFDKVHIDMKDVYTDVESYSDEDEDDEEEKEYNKVFEEKVENEGDEFEPEEDEETSNGAREEE